MKTNAAKSVVGPDGGSYKLRAGRLGRLRFVNELNGTKRGASVNHRSLRNQPIDRRTGRVLGRSSEQRPSDCYVNSRSCTVGSHARQPL